MDRKYLAASVENYLQEPCGESFAQLQEAVPAPHFQLLKMLNSLPDGFRFLVELRADLLSYLAEETSLEVLDHDLEAQFEAWFNVNLWTFEDISLDLPASLLEKLVAYEAGHATRSCEYLKNRLDEDHRCNVFFHPKISTRRDFPNLRTSPLLGDYSVERG